MTTTINAPATADINKAIPLSVTTDVKGKVLSLGVGESLNIAKDIPYEFTLTRKDDSTEQRAVHNDNQGVLGVYALDSNWIRGSDSELIYGNDNQILEGTE